MDSAAFDQFAEDYDVIHRQSIAVTGESPAFFHEYKIKVLAGIAQRRNLQPENMLDFGSGIGNSTPYFRRYFPSAKLAGADVSQRSLDVAEERFPGAATGLRIEENRIPAPDGAFDVTFSACVFHHIAHEEHVHWLSELRRVTRIGGMLAIFEHNPLNPLTLRAVNNCPFDADARLIRANQLLRKIGASGWSDFKAQYHVFFPHALARLRVLEPYLSAVPLGGQYAASAIRND